MFFDDDKKDKPVDRPKPEGVLGLIVGAVIEALFLTYKGCGIAILWLGKKIFGQYFESLGHLLDFRNVEKEVALRRIAIALCLLILFPGIPLFYLYKTPAVRDYVTLSQTTTVNIPMPGRRIFFPDRSYFVPMEKRKVLDFRSFGAGGLYLTYPLHDDESMYVVNNHDCQLVTRALPITILSKKFPIGAEGFEDKVTYYVTHKIGDLFGIEYALELVYNPRYFFKSKDELANITTTFARTKSWRMLKIEWAHLETLPSGNKAFTVKARTNEHAIICS